MESKDPILETEKIVKGINDEAGKYTQLYLILAGLFLLLLTGTLYKTLEKSRE